MQIWACHEKPRQSNRRKRVARCSNARAFGPVCGARSDGATLYIEGATAEQAVGPRSSTTTRGPRLNGRNADEISPSPSLASGATANRRTSRSTSFNVRRAVAGSTCAILAEFSSTNGRATRARRVKTTNEARHAEGGERSRDDRLQRAHLIRAWP